MAETVAKPLTEELVATHLSALAKSANGLGLAFVKLELHGQGITSVDILSNYPHLRYLDLSDNNLATFAPGLASTSPLLALDLHANSLTSFPAAEVAGKRYLQHINLARNAMEGAEVGKDVTLPAATWMNLNENKISGAFHFTSLPELLHLEARGNQLTSMRGIPAPKLQRLYLATNSITGIEGLEGKRELTTLHLRDNGIAKLDGFSADLDRLATLNLRGNKIASFDEIAKLSILPALRNLTLLGNAALEENASYRFEVIGRLKDLQRLDKEEVTPEEREDAVLYLENAMRARAAAPAETIAEGGGEAPAAAN